MNRPRDEIGRFAYTDHQVMHRGYKMVYMPEHKRAKSNGYVYEHILVAEAKLCRSLGEKEIVHHIDGDKLNNTPDNLMVFATSSDHMKCHWEARNHNYKTSDGKLRTIEELAEMGGVSYMTAYQRLKKLGWTPDETISGTRKRENSHENILDL